MLFVVLSFVACCLLVDGACGGLFFSVLRCSFLFCVLVRSCCLLVVVVFLSVVVVVVVVCVCCCLLFVVCMCCVLSVIRC